MIHSAISRESIAHSFRRAAALASSCVALGGFAATAEAKYRPYSEPKKLVGEMALAVVPVQIKGETQLPFDTATMHERTFGQTNSVASYFQASSFGKLAVRGEVLEPIDIPKSTIDEECSYDSLVKIGVKALKTAEKKTDRDYKEFSNYAFVVARSKTTDRCDLSGQSIGNGSINFVTRKLSTTINNTTHTLPADHFPIGTVIHELGHNLGLSHANGVQCLSGKGRTIKYNIARDYAGKCQPELYGDPVDAMGMSAYTLDTPPHLSAINIARAGWLEPRNLQTIKQDGLVTIAPVETKTTSPQLIRIPIRYKAPGYSTGPKIYYYLDYRQIASHTDTADRSVSGVSVRVSGSIADGADAIRHSNYTNFIDTTPNTPNPSDGTLAVGKTFTDTAAGISIKTVGTGPEGATVQISRKR